MEHFLFRSICDSNNYRKLCTMKRFAKILIPILLFLVIPVTASFAQQKSLMSKKWENTYLRLEFTRDLQASFAEKVADKEIRDAEGLLRRARRQIGSNRLIIANRSLNEANNVINRALRKLLTGPLKKQQDDLDNLIETAKQVVQNSENPNARKLLSTGIDNKNSARQLFRQNEFQRALKLLSQATFQIQRSIDIVKNSDQATKEGVAEEKVRLEKLLGESENVISASANSTVKKNYRQALKLSGKAEEAEAKQDFQQSIQYYHQATRLLLRAIDLAEVKADRTAVRAHEEVAALDELIENLQSKFDEAGQDDKATIWGTRILQLQRDAHEAIENKNYKLCLMNTQLARDMIQRILNKTQTQRTDAGDILHSEFDQLEIDIDEITDRANQAGNVEATILLRYGRAAKVKGEQFLQNRNLRLARESLLTANRFVFAADRLVRNEAGESPAEEEIQRKIKTLEQDANSFRDEAKKSRKPEVRIYFEQSTRMLDLARENAGMKYFFVANECAEYAGTLLEKARAAADK